MQPARAKGFLPVAKRGVLGSPAGPPGQHEATFGGHAENAAADERGDPLRFDVLLHIAQQVWVGPQSCKFCPAPKDA